MAADPWRPICDERTLLIPYLLSSDRSVGRRAIARCTSARASCHHRSPRVPKSPGTKGTASDVQKRGLSGAQSPVGDIRLPIAAIDSGVQSAARVQGGEAGERSERTLDAREH
jgi:hypothetical protein